MDREDKRSTHQQYSGCQPPKRGADPSEVTSGQPDKGEAKGCVGPGSAGIQNARGKGADGSTEPSFASREPPRVLPLTSTAAGSLATALREAPFLDGVRRQNGGWVECQVTGIAVVDSLMRKVRIANTRESRLHFLLVFLRSTISVVKEPRDGWPTAQFIENQGAPRAVAAVLQCTAREQWSERDWIPVLFAVDKYYVGERVGLDDPGFYEYAGWMACDVHKIKPVASLSAPNEAREERKTSPVAGARAQQSCNDTSVSVGGNRPGKVMVGGGGGGPSLLGTMRSVFGTDVDPRIVSRRRAVLQAVRQEFLEAEVALEAYAQSSRGGSRMCAVAVELGRLAVQYEQSVTDGWPAFPFDEDAEEWHGMFWKKVREMADALATHWESGVAVDQQFHWDECMLGACESVADGVDEAIMRRMGIDWPGMYQSRLEESERLAGVVVKGGLTVEDPWRHFAGKDGKEAFLVGVRWTPQEWVEWARELDLAMVKVKRQRVADERQGGGG